MKRTDLAQLVKDKLSADDVVICGLGSTEAAYKSIGPKGPTYFASDPMGIWPSVALGLALAVAAPAAAEWPRDKPVRFIIPQATSVV